MLCPLHRLPALASGEAGRNNGQCDACRRLGLLVETVELDKVDRALDTLQEQGYEVDLHRSHAVIVASVLRCPRCERVHPATAEPVKCPNCGVVSCSACRDTPTAHLFWCHQLREDEL